MIWHYMDDKTVGTNRRAFHDYAILEKFEAGIALLGPEVKSMRAGGLSLQDSYVRPEGRELFVYNMHIAPYLFGNINNPEPMRVRKLLLHRRQINKLIVDLTTQHLALIPLSVYFKNGIVKVEIGLAKGKKLYDKRRAIRDREADREMKRAIRKRI